MAAFTQPPCTHGGCHAPRWTRASARRSLQRRTSKRGPAVERAFWPRNSPQPPAAHASGQNPASVLFYSRLEHHPNFAMFQLNESTTLGLWAAHDAQPASSVRGGGTEICVTLANDAAVEQAASAWEADGLAGAAGANRDGLWLHGYHGGPGWASHPGVPAGVIRALRKARTNAASAPTAPTSAGCSGRR